MQYDAIVVGGGVIGLSVAWRLGERGLRTLLIERHTLGAGSSSRGVGGFRQQFEQPIDIALSQLSLPVLLSMRDEIELYQHGYLYLALSEDSWTRMQQRAAWQRNHGVPVETLDREQLRSRFPYLNTVDLHGGLFCDQDGYASPRLAIQAYARRARATGVQMIEGVEVRDLTLHGERVAGVVTDHGSFSTSVVINAAGAWSAKLAAMAGIDLPVTPLKRQTWLSAPTTVVPRSAPLTIDADTGWHFRPRDGALLFAMSGHEIPGDESLDLDPTLPDRMLAHGRHRLPRLDVGLVHGNAGLYELTPDAHPILGEARERPGLYFACGFSGHGFMHSPATGLVIAALICGDAPAIDIAPLTLERFHTGALLGSGSVL